MKQQITRVVCDSCGKEITQYPYGNSFEDPQTIYQAEDRDFCTDCARKPFSELFPPR